MRINNSIGNYVTAGAAALGFAFAGCSNLYGTHLIYEGDIINRDYVTEHVTLRSDSPSLSDSAGLYLTVKTPTRSGSESVLYADHADTTRGRPGSDRVIDILRVVEENREGDYFGSMEYRRDDFDPYVIQTIRDAQPDFERYLAAIESELRKKELAKANH